MTWRHAFYRPPGHHGREYQGWFIVRQIKRAMCIYTLKRLLLFEK